MFADGAIFLLAGLTPTQHVDLVSDHLLLDEEGGLVLARVGRRGRADDLPPFLLVVKLVQVVVALRLPTGDDVVVVVGLDGLHVVGQRPCLGRR